MNLGTFTTAQDGRYVMTVAASGITLELDRVRRERHQLEGELTVKCTLAGAQSMEGGIISASDFNCSSQQARTTRAKYLAERARTKPSEVDWVGILEEFCVRVVGFDREGEGRVWMKDVAAPERGGDFTVNGLRLLNNMPALIFGDSGRGKSMLAAYLAGLLVLNGRSVLYADWEFSGDQHADRCRRFFGEVPDKLGYIRCERPLVHEVDRLRRIIQRDGFQYLICDSVAFAALGAPEASESAQGYYQALRQLGIGSLNVAHITKGQGQPGEEQRQSDKPFGSTFWAAGARAMWFFKSEDTPKGFALALYPKKANDGSLGRSVGFEFEFSDAHGPIAVSCVEVTQNRVLAGGLPIWQQMAGALSRGAMTASALADELDIPLNTVVQNAKRKDRTFVRVLGSDGVQKIGLVSR